jgi:hypothetical protein
MRVDAHMDLARVPKPTRRAGRSPAAVVQGGGVRVTERVERHVVASGRALRSGSQMPPCPVGQPALGDAPMMGWSRSGRPHARRDCFSSCRVARSSAITRVRAAVLLVRARLTVNVPSSRSFQGIDRISCGRMPQRPASSRMIRSRPMNWSRIASTSRGSSGRTSSPGSAFTLRRLRAGLAGSSPRSGCPRLDLRLPHRRAN